MANNNPGTQVVGVVSAGRPNQHRKTVAVVDSAGNAKSQVVPQTQPTTAAAATVADVNGLLNALYAKLVAAGVLK